jgi:hypothetical protein
MLQGSERRRNCIRRAVFAVALPLLSACGQDGGPAITAGGACSSGSSTDDISLFLAGDSIIVKPWSQVDDPAFLALVAQIREADVAIANLDDLLAYLTGSPGYEASLAAISAYRNAYGVRPT